MIYGDRIKQLRELHKLTQSGMVDFVPELTQPQLSRIEKGRAEADAEVGALIAANTGVTPAFLERPPIDDLKAHTPQFRARSRVTEASRNSALQWARLIYEQHLRMSEGIHETQVNLETLHGVPPREAAQEVRSWLGFDRLSPLPYLVLAVEKLGVTVLGLPVVERNLDAFCAWRGNYPVIGLMDGVPGDRLRFTLAHELGHLVLHDNTQSGPEIEAEADAFAAELLTPLGSIRRDLGTRPTLSSLIMLKTSWGVSVKALIRRARELGVLDQERAISLYKQISARGWNRSEPGHVPLEKPRTFRKLSEARFGEGPNIEAMSVDAGWSEELTLDILERHCRGDELPFSGHRKNLRSVDNVVSLGLRLKSR